MQNGRVRFFNDIVGCGFIESDCEPGVIRFSYREIRKTGYRIVNEGQLVKFRLVRTSRGPFAVDIIPESDQQ
ncbi:MAG: cold shock domain-containing protein [Fibrobacter sp.]|jgi:cold shock CspA family protein|nr:cold shock domain-containing protein [Fibrobacter sp.]HON09238.1 cold shock domain-containing protein [Chitinispirillaceae bacterium]